MKITDIRIYPFDTARSGGKIRAIVDVEFDGKLVVKGIRILETRNGGLFLGMPSVKTRSGQYRDLVLLKDKDFAKDVRHQIIDAYSSAGTLKTDNGGYNED